MEYLIKNAIIVDAKSDYHLQKRDILIENGIITNIASTIKVSDKSKVIELDNLHVSTGWFDSSVSFGEPGFEERETIANGLKTAAHSGFTDIILNTNTNPVPDNKGAIRFIKSNGEKAATSIHPAGTFTQSADGEHLAELFDMSQDGAVSFYDYKKPIKNPNLLKIGLQYTQRFDAIVQSFPLETSISPKGIVNEHINSTQLGLKGVPSLSETLQISRDLAVLEYTEGRLHIPTISTSKSVSLIREAKKNGLNVTCSVAAHNLYLTDDELHSFDTSYKLTPPLRTKEDIKALIKGVKDGTIDMVTSDHNPIDVENKNIEFDHAAYGSIGLESCFGTMISKLDIETAINALTKQSQFNLKSTTIEIGSTASITLFNPSIEWTFNTSDILSTSNNAAMLGKKLTGRAYGIFNNKKLALRKL